jgi:pimeloyl-ACP methyl ester carboxylesterase
MKQDRVSRSRRQLLATSLGCTAALTAATRSTNADAAGRRRALRLDEVGDSLHALVKLRGDLAGGRVLQCYAGTLTLAVPGRTPLPVASYQGLIRTDWTPRADGSFSYRTFDLGFFGDLADGRPVESLVNPLSGERIEPLDVRDGPVQSVYSTAGILRDGLEASPGSRLAIPWRSAGDDVWYSSEFEFTYANPLPPDRYPEVSSTRDVAQRSQFTYLGRRSELEDPRRTSATSRTVMLVVSTIHPWLRMGRMPGQQVIHTIARKIGSIEEAPRPVVDYMERRLPEFLTAGTPFVGAGNSFERWRRERAVAPPAPAEPVPPPSPATTRRWRSYARGRYGQVHFSSAEPAATGPRATPLICLHPSPLTGEIYADLQAELATDRIVHCPDTPGFGYSDPPPHKPTIADYGGAVGDALADQGYGGAGSPLGPVDVFGFHTGALVALELALQRKAMVRKLVLCGVPHYTAADRPRQRAAHVTPQPFLTDRDYVPRLFARLVLDAVGSGTPEQRLRRFGDRLRAGSNGWWGIDAVFTYDSVSALPRLRVPTMLLAFDEEMTQPTRDAAQLVPQALLREMPELPLFGFIVDPRAVATTLREFLAQA